MDTVVQVVSMVVALITGVGIMAAWRKIRPEIRSTDAETLQKYMDMLEKSADRERKYRESYDKRETTLMGKVATLTTRVDELEEKLTEAMDQLDKFTDWARRLSAQVISLDGTPVPFERKHTGNTEPIKGD